MAIAAVLVGASLYMFAVGTDEPYVFKVALLLTGVVEATVCFYALRGSRVGWSFALALNGTLSGALFFGSPKVRDAVGVDLSLGLLPCLLFLVTTILLALSSREY